MKHGNALAIGLLALALAGCGGRGVNHSTSTPVATLSNDYRVEAVLTDPTKDPQYIYVDPLNIQTSEQINFQLVNYTGTGTVKTRNVVTNGVTFSTSDTTKAAGGLNTDGSFTASSNDTGSNRYIVTAVYQGQSYSAYYRVNPRQILLRGRVLSQATNADGGHDPVYNATIDFYANRNPLDPSTAIINVATVHTAADGTYRVSLPAFNDLVTTAHSDGSTFYPGTDIPVPGAAEAPEITFTVRASALPVGFAPSFFFEGTQYTAGSQLSLPVLLSHQSVTDADTGETFFLPFKSGDRYLVDETDGDVDTNGTILLQPAGSS